MRGLAIALIMAPAVAMAGPWDGVYRQAANAECLNVGADGGSLMIADGLFHGVGMVCEMTLPVDVLDMEATLYTMVCDGTDLDWTERAMIMRDAQTDGIIMVWNGYAFRYERCPDPD